MTTTYPKVSIIVPCRNEREHIDNCIRHLLSQTYVGETEVIVADGDSDDGTSDKLAGWADREPRVRVVENPKRIVSTGLNEAITAATGEVIVRADVHTGYADDYVQSCVNTLRETGATNVGGPWRARGKSPMQQTVAMAFQSAFSSGGAPSHRENYEGELDSVYLGCWWKADLERLGMFDEELVRNQDDELNLRIVKSGGLVWQSPKILSWYYPRSSLKALFRQYFQYGYWKIRVIQKHRLPASPRHVVPAAALLIGMLLVFATPFLPWAIPLLAGLAGAYFVLSLIASLQCGRRSGRWRSCLALPVVFAAFHLGYAAGSLKGIVDFLILRRGADPGMSTLTR